MKAFVISMHNSFLVSTVLVLIADAHDNHLKDITYLLCFLFNLMDKGLEYVTREIETAFNKFFITFEDSVFMFNADHIVVACCSQCSKIFRPFHIAQPGRRGICQPMPNASTPR